MLHSEIGVPLFLQVGVDVEETSRLLKTDVLKLASRKFSAVEAATLAKMECPQARHSRFVELWTLKVRYYFWVKLA